MDSYLNLAKKTIEKFIKEKKVLEISPNIPEKMLKKRAAVFVTIHKKSTSQLRGCIGTFVPTCKNVAGEIIQNAVSAATKDPRFPPISEKELEDLEIKVDILSEPEETNESNLNPKKYGLMVKAEDGKTGLLLPDIEGVETKEQQIRICKEKAWIAEDEPVKLYRFKVERHE